MARAHTTFRSTSAPLVAGLLLLAGCERAPGTAPVTPAASVHLGELSAAASKTDKGPGGHHYTDTYERYMFELKDQPIRIFEIGVADGGSLAMWQQYFPAATIMAVDIENKSQFNNPRVTTFVADQANRDQMRAVVSSTGGNFDILVDDGGHSMEQQQVSFGLLFPQVKPGGLYIIEDVHTSLPALWQGYGVTRDGRNTTLKMLEDYMASAPPRFASEYLSDDELAYLDGHVESLNLVYRPESKSLMCIVRKTR